jgi:hypothetical protein
LNPKHITVRIADGIHMKGCSLGSVSMGAARGKPCGGVRFVDGLEVRKMLLENRKILVTVTGAFGSRSQTVAEGKTISGAMEKFLQQYLQNPSISVEVVEQACVERKL